MNISTSHPQKPSIYNGFIRKSNLLKSITNTFFLVLFIFSSSATKAQFDIGIKGGYGYNRYIFQKSYFKQGFLPIYNGGIMVQYLNNQKLGVQSSVEITQKGWEEITTDESSSQFKMDYVQLNFLSLIKFSSKKENGLFIKFGPYFAYSYNSSYTVSGSSDSLYFNYDSLTTSYNKLDYGLRVGLSYKFKIKHNSIQLEVLYAQGLYNILERDASTIFQSLNQSLFINIAYTFTLTRKEERVKKKKKEKL